MKDQINKDTISAMKSKDSLTLGVLRAVKTAISVAEKSNQKGEVDVLNIVKKQIKQRQDSSKLYKEAGRLELAEKEDKEIEILEKYLPKQIEESEAESIVEKIIEKVGASSRQDMGKVMGAAQKIIMGRFDNKKLSQIVLSKLQ